MREPSNIIVRWVDSVDDLPAGLWSASFRPPLEGRWWYAAMENCGIADQFTFAYAVLERDGEPIGIAPTFLMDVPLDIIAPEQIAGVVRFVGKYIRPLRYQRTLFVGSPCSDEGSVGLLPGVTLQEVAPRLQAALNDRARKTKTSMIVWKDFIDADATALANVADTFKLFRVTSYPGTRVELPAGNFEAYLKSLKGSHRHNLKKKLARGQKTLPTESSVVQHPNPDVQAEIFPLFWQTYLKGKTKFEKLNPKFFDLIAAEPTSHFVLIRAKETGRLVAFMLCLDCGPRVINKFIGIDYTLPNIDNAFLYFQLWQAAVIWAMGKGFQEIQSGQTGYRAKIDVGHSLVPLTNFCRHRNPIVHKIFAWQAKEISWETIDHDLKIYLKARSEK